MITWGSSTHCNAIKKNTHHTGADPVLTTKIKIMKTEKEKIELEIQKLTDKRDNSSDTFNRIRLFNQIKKLKDKLEKL
jgi:hypothetical protein